MLFRSAAAVLTVQEEELQATLNDLEQLTGERTDLLTVMESRLIDQRLKKMMIPTQQPLPGADVGSRFGWRIDPFTGRQALHTGLDFSGEVGTPIVAKTPQTNRDLHDVFVQLRGVVEQIGRASCRERV